MANVTLNGIPLVLDPNDYQIFGGARRGSAHRVIDGASTGIYTIFQDRGMAASDEILTLSGLLPDLATVRLLVALFKTASTGFTFTDFYGNSWTVVFTPGSAFPVKQVQGANAWRYDVSLSVVAVLSEPAFSSELATEAARL